MTVVVVDFGGGNVGSVLRALTKVSADAVMSADPAVIDTADRLILPGVGAFGEVLDALKNRNLLESIRNFLRSGRPFLGICVGMQLLFSRSHEFGDHPGFDVIPGDVVSFPRHDTMGNRLKSPHIGWNTLHCPPRLASWDGTLLSTQKEGDAVYFVHSYFGKPADENHILAETVYGGIPITAAVKVGNIVGVQFHPEKSGPIGLSIFKNFLHA